MRSRRLRRKSKLYGEDVNPMDGIINIVDAMLVFACGLMLSLVIYWNVDLNGLTDVEQGADVTEVEGVQDGIDENADGSASYEKMGTVYRDPATGKLYMTSEVPNEEEE